MCKDFFGDFPYKQIGIFVRVLKRTFTSVRGVAVLKFFRPFELAGIAPGDAQGGIGTTALCTTSF